MLARSASNPMYILSYPQTVRSEATPSKRPNKAALPPLRSFPRMAHCVRPVSVCSLPVLPNHPLCNR